MNDIIGDCITAGFRVLRFWMFENREISEQISKLNEICDAVSPHGIKLIVSLADKWGYMQNYKIDESWYREGYKNGYLDYISQLTGALSGRDEIMLWELINEPWTDNFDVFCDFVVSSAGAVRKADPNHMISVGTVGGIGDKLGSYFSLFRKGNFRKLYSMDLLDAVSLHDYSYDSGIFERLDVLYRFKGRPGVAAFFSGLANLIDMPFGIIDGYFRKKKKLFRFPLTLRWLWNIYNKGDISFAKQIGKPVYTGETGLKKMPGRNRPEVLQLDLEEKFGSGIDGVLLWSFEAQGWNKDGHDYGFGLGEGIGEVVKKWNGYLLDPPNPGK
jgi:endo-1,4-beta-mannosidase